MTYCSITVAGICVVCDVTERERERERMSERERIVIYIPSTVVSSSMRKLSTTTNVLANPENLPEEVFRRVTKQEGDRFQPR